MRSFLLGAKTVEGAFNVPFGVERHVPPSIPDRLEFDIEANSGTMYNTVFCGYIDSVGFGHTSNGEGDVYYFEHTSTGLKNTWFAFNGTDQISFSSSGMKTRWMEFSGSMRLSLSYMYTTQSNLNIVKRIVIPSYCGIANTSTTKSMPNCVDAYFPNRTFEQVLSMNGNMRTMFCNATWHCTDGDFLSDGTRT